MHTTLSRGLSAAAIFASYLGVFAIFALPWLRTAGHAIPAFASERFDLRDAKLGVWILAWGAHAIGTDPTRLLDANIFHPAPRQLTGSEMLLSSQLVAAPLFWTTDNAVLTTNVLVFLTYPLAAWAMQRLARALGCTAPAAWLAGLAFALGPLRVPVNLQIPQYLNLWLPLVVLALERLRAEPNRRRTGALAAVLVLTMTSSFYLAIMAALVTVTWALVAAAREDGRRRGFLGRSILALMAASIVVAGVSAPYFRRIEIGAVSGHLRASVAALAAEHWAFVVADPVALVGAVPLILAVLGLLGFHGGGPGARRAAWHGTALVAVGALFMLGPVLPVGDRVIPLPFALLGQGPIGFARAPWRFAVVLGFGVALLVAAAMDVVGRRLGRSGAVVLAFAVGASVLATRGRALTDVAIAEVPAMSTDRAVYEAVREEVARRGGGPLLELPAGDGPNADAFAPDHMIASTIHWLPLVTGYTGYPPRHRHALFVAIARLPDPAAFADLVDMTGLRFVLLAPVDRWPPPGLRDAILASPALEPILERDGWVLARLTLTPDGTLLRRIAAGE